MESEYTVKFSYSVDVFNILRNNYDYVSDLVDPVLHPCTGPPESL